MIAHHAARRIAVGIALVMVADLSTKFAAATLAAGHRTGPFVPIQNPEFSLGTARGPLVLMILLAATGIAFAAHHTIRPALRAELSTWIPACVLGGALANLTDRIAFGAVHDFLATPWMVFNLADLAVTAGLAGWLVTAHTHSASRKEVTA